METQEIFLELQEQLSASKAGQPSSNEKSAKMEQKLEEVVSSLARKAGFEMTAVLGIGGQGAVIKAKDLKLNREVALKFLPPETVKNQEKIEELKREAEVVSRIKHENVVSVLSWHEEDGVPFYAMELVEGEPLIDFIRRSGKLTVTDAMRITIEVARGVEELHRYNIVHRDIKPQNILLSKDGRVKITDFGISNDTESIEREARQKKIAGTPQFMAPEQARGEAATKHSDIYSLAATLYYCLSGKAPVKVVSNVKEQLRIVGEGKPVPIGNYLPKLHREVGKVIMKGLHPNPTRRAWDLAAYRQELEAAFITQMKENDGGFWPFLRRNRWLLAPTVGLGVGLVLGTMYGRQSAPTPEPQPVPIATPPVDTEFSKDQVLTIISQGAAVDFKILSTIATADPQALEAKQLLDQYRHAFDQQDDVLMAELSPQISLSVSKWLSLSMANLVLLDQTSTINDAALQVSEPNSLEDNALYSAWLKKWILYLHETNQRVDAMRRAAGRN